MWFVGTNASWLWLVPEFKILDTVVITLAIEMVNVFSWSKKTAKFFLHDKTVFKNVPASFNPYPNVPSGVSPTSTLPPTILSPGATASCITKIVCATLRASDGV